MDEMTAFDRQIAGEVLLGAGPPEPVDDLAIYEAVTAASRSARWGFTVFSALKFITAAVIVALFGGFLLRGILTAPQQSELPPAAVTESPSPMTTEALLSGMVTEEVEPGVFRIINDGVRDLALVATADDDQNIVAGLDGSVWLFTPELSFRLGDGKRVDIADWGLGPREADIEIGPDGRVWVIVERGEGSTDLFTLADRTIGDEAARIVEGRALPTDEAHDLFAIEARPDGSVFGVWPDTRSGDRARTAVTVGIFADGWIEDLVIEEPESEWSEGLDLRQDHLWLERGFWDLTANDDKVWLADPTGSLHRRTASGWDAEVPPFPPDQIDVGPDGTLWIQAGDFHGWTGNAANEEVLSLMLGRLDDGQWETWDRDDGIPPVGPVAFSYSFPLEGVHAVAPDGSIWLAALDHMAKRECGGIVTFDGTNWTRYLAGLCVYDADIAPDGAVWLQAGEVSYDPEPGPNAIEHLAPVATYVITPEAGSATLSADEG
ncbi:MAG: hypothetical protein PVG27_02220 [Chloroflexota bacterium]|jgi:hypothetical protein